MRSSPWTCSLGGRTEPNRPVHREVSLTPRNMCAMGFPLYNPNMNGGTFFAADAGVVRPIQMQLLKVRP